MDKLNVTLSRNDLGQILEGLDVLIEQWEATADYLENGGMSEDVCIRESHSANEANSIADTYRQIQGTIREQLDTHQ